MALEFHRNSFKTDTDTDSNPGHGLDAGTAYATALCRLQKPFALLGYIFLFDGVLC